MDACIGGGNHEAWGEGISPFRGREGSGNNRDGAGSEGKGTGKHGICIRGEAEVTCHTVSEQEVKKRESGNTVEGEEVKRRCHWDMAAAQEVRKRSPVNMAAG